MRWAGTACSGARGHRKEVCGGGCMLKVLWCRFAEAGLGMQGSSLTNFDAASKLCIGLDCLGCS